MISKANQGVLRIILASLLSSELNPTEMRKFAQDLDDPENIRKIQDLIYRVVEGLRQTDYRSENKITDHNELFEFIQRKRLSKSFVREVMSSVTPTMRELRNNDNITMRELVQAFVKTGPNKVEQFINMINNDHDDPFLKGIIARDRR